MSGQIILCATPIGNLGDITLRALEALRACDVIAAEDTRNALKLLNHYDIHKPMLSFHAHNRFGRGQEIVELAKQGKVVVVISDAGMPGISDPGEELVTTAAHAGVPLTLLPGASASLMALVLSGLSSDRFVFEGFLPRENAPRRTRISQLYAEYRTMILYESPHQLVNTLTDLYNALGERNLTIARELTKLHEEVLRLTLSEAIVYYEHTPVRGEFVLVLEGSRQQPATLDDLDDLLSRLSEDNRSPAQIARELALMTGLPKNAIYQRILQRRGVLLDE